MTPEQIKKLESLYLESFSGLRHNNTEVLKQIKFIKEDSGVETRDESSVDIELLRQQSKYEGMNTTIVKVLNILGLDLPVDKI